MKKFTKLFLSCAAVAAVTAAVATTAMAAEINIQPDGANGLTGAKYNTETNTVTVVAPTDADTAKDMTFLVIVGGVDTEVQQGNVIGIDQNTGLPANTGLIDGKVVDAEAEEQTYTVKLGYYTKGENSTFKVATGTFKSGKSTGTKVLVGDADGTGTVDGVDAVYVLTYLAGDKTAITAENFPAAYYCDGDTVITGIDAVEILTYQAGDKNREFVGKTMEVPAAPAAPAE